jgi:hypothetical protein
MKCPTVFLVISALAASTVAAHEGPRIWIGNVGGTITTFSSDNDLDPTIYTPSRLFTTELEEFSGIFTKDFPGYEVRQTGGNVASNTTFGFNIAGPALYFDEAADLYVTVQAMFGPPGPGPVPQLAITEGANRRDTASGPVSGFNFFTFNSIGDHSHLAYTLLGDGVNPVDGPSGVYAIPFNLTSQSLATSETYYLLVGKGVAVDDPLFESAIAVAQATLVPDVVPGDMDCNGILDEEDIAGFVLAMLDPAGYSSTYPSCNMQNGDMSGDEFVNGKDVQSFTIALLQ